MSNSAEVSQSGQIVRDSSTAKRINNLLNLCKTRLEGLQLLDLFLPQCPDEDFLNFCITWMQNCCKLDGLTNKNCAARLLRDLLRTSSNYPELKKSVSFFITTRYFDFFFKYFLNSEAGWTCTETCLLLYRGACGPFQEGLEKHLTKEVERGAKVSPTVGRCFALLPCVGGGGNEGVNYKRNWKSQFDKFLSVCNSILNDLGADAEDVQENRTIERPHKNNNKRDGNVERLAVRLHNYSSVLSSMLLNPYPAPKNIPSDLVFQLICRGLALNPKASGKFLTIDVASLQNALPDIYRSFISLLKALIVTCKNQLLPYARLIGKLIKQSLQWSNEFDVSHGNGKAFDRSRTTTYETLCEWLTVARSGSCIELVSDVVISSAVNDIRPKKEVVSLKGAKLEPQQATRKTDATADWKLCRAALRALQFLIKFLGVLLKPEVHKFLQEIVVKLLVEVQKSAAPDVIARFAEPACRSELYGLLLELVHQPCPKWPPPTNFALRLFAGGMNDISPQVSSFCSTALNFATVIIHPQYDNGGFPPRYPRDGSTREEEAAEVADVEALPLFPPVEHETVQSESVEGGKEKSSEANETDASKMHDTDDASEISSDEDSRNTISFSKDFGQVAKEPVGADDRGERESSPRRSEAEEEPVVADDGGERESSPRRSEAEEEPGAKRRRKEDPPREKTPSPAGESPASGRTPPIVDETLNTEERKKLDERNQARDSSGPDGFSPELINEESHPKARYFLRSKSVRSSEEPDEMSKGTSSPESLKGTPAKILAKSTPRVSSIKKRRRTKTLPQLEVSVDGDIKTSEKGVQFDEEDIRAAFYDSFVD